MKDYNKELENNLLEMVRQKEESGKRLLRMEILVGILCLLPLIAAVIVALTVSMEEWLGGLVAGLSLIPLLIATPFMIRIEQKAGYYRCKNCAHRYVPTYKSVFLAAHVNRTRYMKCPKCGKRTWSKKVISKSE